LENIDDKDFDELADIIAPLIKYRQEIVNPTEIDKLNFTDMVKTKEMIEFGPENEAVSITKYKEMVEAKIAELLRKNLILQKLKDGAEINEEESRQLAEQLQKEDPHITEPLLQKVYKNRKAKFIQFIKHILGIEILESFDKQVSKAVEQFIQIHSNLTTNQIEFLHLLRDYIIEKGKLEKRDLIQAPFTIIHPKGIRGVFSPAEIKEILELTETLVA
jgi:type I restriction enzyme R subunit